MHFGFILVGGDTFDVACHSILNICDMADLDWLLFMFKMDKSEYSSSPCVDLWGSLFYFT